VLLHEAQHVARHEPLRRLAMRAICDALRIVPGLRALSQGQAALSELAADAQAVGSAGTARDLASALVTLDEHRDAGAAGIAPERVDHLLGALPRWSTPTWALAGLATAVAALLASLCAVLSPGHHDVCRLVFHAPAMATASAVAVITWSVWVGRQAVAAIRPLDDVM
jgi:hypothetical protein